jgi:hypothetical protein
MAVSAVRNAGIMVVGWIVPTLGFAVKPIGVNLPTRVIHGRAKREPGSMYPDATSRNLKQSSMDPGSRSLRSLGRDDIL